MNEAEWIGKNKKAIAPLRVSSAGQEGNTSWLTQKRDCEEYCRRHGLELIEAVQIVESAKTSELRKKYSAVLKRALKQNIQHILFHKYDREARNLTDNETNETSVREGKIVLHYVADGKVLHKNSSDTDFLMRDYHAVQNKHYSRDLSTKVRKATQMKAETGWYPGTHPPDGYINEKLKTDRGFERRRGSIIVRDSNATTLKRVQREFEIRAEHPTPPWSEVRRRVISEGLVPVDEIKTYYIGTIERRLKNIFYDCRFIWSGVEYVGKHERIISETLFWKVQETFGIKNFTHKNTGSMFGHGWMSCGEPTCGCSIVYDPLTKKIKETGEIKTFKYYHCSNGKRIHASLKGMRVSEESLLEQLSEAPRQISIREDFRDELMRAVNETLLKMRRAVKDDLDRFEAVLVASKERENRAYDRYDSGEIDKDTYNQQRKRLQEEQLQYARMMKDAQLTINDAAAETVESIIQLATNVDSLWKHMTTEERRLLLDKLLSNRVLDGASVRYEIIKPLRTLGEMRENVKWRRERDSNS
jgi:DNA invertase Pin-like site-specific DNA recombinase